MGRLKPIPQLKNGGNGLPKTGIGGKNNRTASIPNKPGDKAIGNGSKPQDIAKDMRDKVGEAVKNFNTPNDQLQEPESVEEPMPDPGSLIDEVPQQSLAGSLNNPGSLNAGNGRLGSDGNNGKDKNGKKKKTTMDKLKGKVKRAIIQTILSHLMPIFIGVMAFGAIGSCSAAMFTGGDNTEIEQTRGQNRKIIINGGSNSNTSSSSSSSSSGTPFDGDWVYYNQNRPTESWNTKYPNHPWGVSCGIVSFAMVARNYSGNDKYNPDWAIENGFSAGGIGDATVNQGNCLNYINSHEDVFHLKGEAIAPSNKSDYNPVIEACKSGGCAVMYIRTAGVKLDWSGGADVHWIVVRDVDEASDTATIADVAIGKESKIKWSELSNPANLANPTAGVFAFTSTAGKK